MGVCLSNKKKNLGVGYMALCVVAGGMVEFGFLLEGAVCVVGGRGGGRGGQYGFYACYRPKLWMGAHTVTKIRLTLILYPSLRLVPSVLIGYCVS